MQHLESNILPSEALDFLNEQEQSKQQRKVEGNNLQYRDELLSWCNDFISRSRQWRISSWEDRWHRYRRDADGIYDPQTSRLKKDWQSKAFIPITPTHRENIQARIFKIMMGPQPPIEVKSRFPGPQDQAENIRDLTLREMEKSDFEVEFNAGLDDATTYGSGFFRIRHEEKYEDRAVREPVQSPIDPFNPVDLSESLSFGSKVSGYSSSIKSVEVFRGCKFSAVSIWDVFPDPSAVEICHHAIALRYRKTYAEVVDGVKQGYFSPESADLLRDVEDSEFEQDDLNLINVERGITDTRIPHTRYQNNLVCYELFARLPKKWMPSLLDGIENEDDGDSLIPMRVIFHEKTVLAVEPSGEYDGEPPVYKMDYWRVPNQFYGRGIPEMLQHIQVVVNESVNQRLDAVNLALTKKYGVIERALVSSKDFSDELGGVIRFDAKAMQALGVSDIRAAFMELNTGTVDRAAFIDPQEMERYAQERTSANRVTIGTAGQVKDANQTLGGMELLLQSAGEKFSYIGMLMEFSALRHIFMAFWKTIYSNIRPQDVLDILGPERSQTFQLIDPDSFAKNYAYIPQGVFTAENKALTQARLQSMYAMFADQPWFDKMAAFDKISKSNNLSPDELKLSPEEMQQMMFANVMLSEAQGPAKLPSGPLAPINQATPSAPGQGI